VFVDRYIGEMHQNAITDEGSMFDKTRFIFNMHKLNQLSVTKFATKLEELLEGKHLYRTIDGRILDFREGIEHAPKKQRFSIRQTRLEPLHTKPSVKPKDSTYRHINRKRKKK